MTDKYGRRINYLRISVTDRCNLRCHYCMPPGGVPLLRHSDLLSYEEITEVTREAVALGFDKIRLTGGEPLVRRGVVELVAMLAALDAVQDLSMTTNGVLLDEYADPLARAGLERVNVSLDTLNPRRYHEVTGGGDLARAVAGIKAAQAAGLRPIKLNCVVEESTDEPDALSVRRFARDNGLEVRFIRRMDLTSGRFWVVEGGSGGDCRACNRLRLSSEGLVRPCLFSDLGFRVRELGAREALQRAIDAKPESGDACLQSTFSRIGG
jgi:cyclic pyranopterin phosphate synthase